MKRKTLMKILAAIVFVLALFGFVLIFLKPWTEKKILAAVNNIDSDYIITVDQVDAEFLPPEIEWKGVRIKSKNNDELDAKIQFMELRGISLVKFFFRNDLDIRTITVRDSDIRARLAFNKMKPVISTLTINAEKILFEEMNLSIENTSDKESWSMKNGTITFYEFQLMK